jgi:sarcosine oxidase subunit beta
MTRTADAVVIGAGVTGLSVALHLAEAGVPPVIVERQGIASGASGIQPGGVRQQWSTELSCVLAREGAAFYRDLGVRLETTTLPVRFDPCGYLFVAHTPAKLHELTQSVAMQNAIGVPSRIVGAVEAAELVPGLDPSGLAGASWCDEDGYVDRPQTAVEAFAVAAAVRGARLEIGDVVSLKQVGNDWQLTLRDGSSLWSPHVVVATGDSTAALVRDLGLDLPIEREERHLFFSNPVQERVLEPLVVSSERCFAAKQLADGRILASDLGAAGEPEVERQRWLGRIRSVIDELLPRLSFASFALLVTGTYDVTPDNQPILGTVDGLPGLHLAAGFSGHGFMLAPAVGRRIAGSVLGHAPDDALQQLSYARFAGDLLHREAATV